MPGKILYLGDTSLDGAASYLAGVMQHAGISFDYFPSDHRIDSETFSDYAAVVLSDFPAANFSSDAQQSLVERVGDGTGLLMCGGWESFQGCDGHWKDTPVGEILPVEIADTDDRVNCDQPLMLKTAAEHSILSGLPWDSRPPIIGGFNQFQAKPDSRVLLECQRFAARVDGDDISFTPTETHPLLVLSPTDSVRVAALATDVAPHWVGPLVDWGDERVSAQAPGAEEIEVGRYFVQFLSQLLKWLGGKS
ncbi:MAG: hypothetical protein CMJ78_15760 [Planctomycetaceae bacterium]|nr:hypothetical protein [Planctomycetaceae bacterium]